VVELLVTLVVLPIARRVGDLWIDRVANALDDQAVHLLRSTVRSNSDGRHLIDYLEEHADQAAKLEEEVKRELGAASIADALALAIGMPTIGSRLEHLRAFLDWTVDCVASTGHAVVFEGTLTDPDFCTYVWFDPSKASQARWSGSTDGLSFSPSKDGPVMICSAAILPPNVIYDRDGGRIDLNCDLLNSRIAAGTWGERGLAKSERGIRAGGSWLRAWWELKNVEADRVAWRHPDGDREWDSFPPDFSSLALLGASVRRHITAQQRSYEQLVAAARQAMTTD
jgi:hypothetical protein